MSDKKDLHWQKRQGRIKDENISNKENEVEIMEKTMDKAIITVVGKDTVGIIAKVCTYLAQNQVNILDISQTIVQGYFNMMMVADTSASDKEIATLSKELAALGDEIGVVIHCQHEDIFNVMHRI